MRGIGRHPPRRGVLRAIRSGRLKACLVVDEKGKAKIGDVVLADIEWTDNTDFSRAPAFVKERAAPTSSPSRGLEPPDVIAGLDARKIGQGKVGRVGVLDPVQATDRRCGGGPDICGLREPGQVAARLPSNRRRRSTGERGGDRWTGGGLRAAAAGDRRGAARVERWGSRRVPTETGGRRMMKPWVDAFFWALNPDLGEDARECRSPRLYPVRRAIRARPGRTPAAAGTTGTLALFRCREGKPLRATLRRWLRSSGSGRDGER